MLIAIYDMSISPAKYIDHIDTNNGRNALIKYAKQHNIIDYTITRYYNRLDKTSFYILNSFGGDCLQAKRMYNNGFIYWG